MTREDLVSGLFSQFTQLRRSGMGRDDAWARIASGARTLPPAEQERLNTMLRQWEAHRDTHAQPPAPTDRQRSAPPIKRLPIESARPIRRIQPVAGGDVRSQDRPAACPKCGTPHADGELYCARCGALLLDETQQDDSTQPLPIVHRQTQAPAAVFRKGMVLTLRIRATNQVLRVRPGRHELIIGRSSSDSVMIPDVDLAPFGAETQGVSRLHAALRRQDDALLLADLGSLNCTFINDQRLHPHEVRILQHGDVVRFGQMAVDVIFSTP